MRQGHATNAHRVLEFMLEKNIRADRLVLFSDMQCYDSSKGDRSLSDAIARYRATLNPRLVVHSADLAGYGKAALSTADPRVHLVSGFSEKILRTVIEFERSLEDPSPLRPSANAIDSTGSSRTNATLDDIRARF